MYELVVSRVQVLPKDVYFPSLLFLYKKSLCLLLIIIVVQNQMITRLDLWAKTLYV